MLYRDPGPPQIAAGLYPATQSFAPDWAYPIDEKITARLMRQYPPGTAVARLIADLMRQGFEAEPPGPSGATPADPRPKMVYLWGESIVCTSQLWIIWTEARDKRLATVEAHSQYVCL